MMYVCTVEVEKADVPFAYRLYYHLHFHYRCNYRARALCVYIFRCVFFTLSPATVAENTPLQVVTMFEGRVCRAALGSGWSRHMLAE